jgi:hypothetical protein
VTSNSKLFLLALPVATLGVLGILVLTSARGVNSAAHAAGSGDRNAPSGPGGASVAVVELFTSQGCSSCPPADRLLSQLASDTHYRGRVIPLSFHVDYWNHIGWQDPYSSPRWSERQKLYAGRAFHTGRIYTPQVVVNGAAECVGSNEADVYTRVRGALAESPAASVSLEADPVTPEGQLRVRAKASLLRANGAKTGPKGELDLWVAVYESGLETEVKAGENASRTLRNDRVVRRFEKAFSLPAQAGASQSGEIALGIDRRWKAAGLGVAAFLQDPATLAIYGAAGGTLQEITKRP